MTRDGWPRPFIGVLLVIVGASAFCVFPDLGVGRPCEAQSVCSAGHVCVRLDPEDDGEGSVCLPMLELDAPQACTADEDCAAAGFPVDSFCQDGLCTCGDADDGFTCNSFDTTEVVGEHTCRCLPALLVDGVECIDDNQCASLRCGDGNCVAGNDGDGCDSDEDCAFSTNATCGGGTCE